MDIEEEIAQALYAEYRTRIPGSLTWENDSKADEFRAQAARLMPALMPLLDRVRAEALREVAVVIDGFSGTCLNASSAAEIIMATADRIEQNSEGNKA